MASSVPAATLLADSIEAAYRGATALRQRRAPGIPRGGGAAASGTSRPTARPCATRRRSRGSARWPSRPRGRASGSARADRAHPGPGRDARGRKQYRYHARWREVRDETKYVDSSRSAARCPASAGGCSGTSRPPACRARRCWPRVVRLLETTLIRVGNEEYARENRSYGLTTLAHEHVRRDGPRLRFEFRGKGGKPHTVDVSDRRLAAHRAAMQELPGHELFQYLDEAGGGRPSTPPTSTRTCGTSPARTSPRRTSAPGPAPCWRPSRCRRSAPRANGRQTRVTRRWPRSRNGSEHARHLPEVLHPSRRADVVPRIDARATAHRGRTRATSVATGATARGARGAEAPPANVRAAPPLGAATS